MIGDGHLKAFVIGAALAAGCAQGAAYAETSPKPTAYDAIIAKHARATGVPEQLIRRIIVRESKYNPSARNRGHYGMMQIKPGTAKAMGYQGDASGLLDADTNLTYGVRYLAGAYKVAGGDQDRAVRLYSSGYYYDAKRRGMLADVGLGRDGKFKAGPISPATEAFQLASADGSRDASSTVPLPPVREAQVVTDRSKPSFFMFGRTQAKLGDPAAVAPAVPQTASSAIPLPPVRDGLSPLVAAKTDVQKPRIIPGTYGEIAAKTAPVSPEAAKLASVLKSKRMIAPGAQPVLASAGPVSPAKPKPPSAPVVPTVASVTPSASVAAIPLPPSRGGFDPDVTGSIKR